MSQKKAKEASRKTGVDPTENTDQPPNTLQGDSAHNRFARSGATWCRCSVERNDCPDRRGISSFGKPPACENCLEPLRPTRTHYHLVQKTLATKLCEECWSKGPLPPKDESTKFRFLTDPGYR